MTLERRRKDPDEIYDRRRQRDLDREMFDGATRCAQCGRVAAELVCLKCGTPRAAYQTVKAQLAAGSLPPVGDKNAAEVLRTLQAQMGDSEC